LFALHGSEMSSCHCALMHHTPQTISKHCESYCVFFYV